MMQCAARLGKKIQNRLPLAILSRVERASFDFEHRLGADTHRVKDGRVQIADRNGLVDGDAWSFLGGRAVQVASFHAATEENDR